MRALRWLGQATAAALALVITAYYCIRGNALVADPDIWWHIRVGDWIAAHHTLPRVGIFSQHLERPWTAYSWGFELLISGIHHIFGLRGMVGLLLCLEILVSLAFLVALRWVAGSYWASWGIGVLTIYAALLHNALRPVLLTVLFFSLELLLIFEAERRRDDRLLFWTAPLLLVWANCHIQFVYGLFVFGLYIAARLVALWRPGEAAARSSPGNGGGASAPGSGALGWKLLVLLALALLSPCTGPNGILPYKVAFAYAGTSANYDVILELAAPNFRRPEDYVLLALIMVACYAAGRRSSRDWFRLPLLLVTALVSFRSMRDTWFAGSAAAFILAEAVRDRWPAEERAPSPSVVPERELAAYGAGALAALALASAFAMHYGLRLPELARSVGEHYPLRAADFVRDSHFPGPLYNSYNWGGFLIYYLPEQPVSIDPRFDLYGTDLLLRSVDTGNAINWKSDPDLARANVVILGRWRPLVQALANDAQFRNVYADNVAVVFVRQTR